MFPCAIPHAYTHNIYIKYKRFKLPFLYYNNLISLPIVSLINSTSVDNRKSDQTTITSLMRLHEKLCVPWTPYLPVSGSESQGCEGYLDQSSWKSTRVYYHHVLSFSCASFGSVVLKDF